MTLPTTGPISLANVNVELGLSSTATISLNQTNVRTLAGIASGTISMSDLRGKTNVTFTPAGGNSAGTAVALYQNGAGGTVSITISCTVSASWSYTRSGTFGSPTTGSTTATSVTFSLLNNDVTPRSTTWTVNATAGGITKYWTVTIDNYGFA
jgi:hypothetical protein